MQGEDLQRNFPGRWSCLRSCRRNTLGHRQGLGENSTLTANAKTNLYQVEKVGGGGGLVTLLDQGGY